MIRIAFILSCAFAAIAPAFLTGNIPPSTPGLTNNTFPAVFEGKPLIDLGLSDRERLFLEDFPGQIGRFTDGNREIIIRRVTQATRRLHPADDCFRAVGYTTTPLPIKIDDRNERWACFSAVKQEESLNVCERIEDNQGGRWTDVSSWYWSAWGKGQSEWWAYTVAERPR